MGAQKNRIIKKDLLSAHNIFPCYALLSEGLPIVDWKLLTLCMLFNSIGISSGLDCSDEFNLERQKKIIIKF